MPLKTLATPNFSAWLQCSSGKRTLAGKGKFIFNTKIYRHEGIQHGLAWQLRTLSSFFFLFLQFTPHLMGTLSFKHVGCLYIWLLVKPNPVNQWRISCAKASGLNLPCWAQQINTQGEHRWPCKALHFLPSPNCIMEHKRPHPGDWQSRNRSNLSLLPALSTWRVLTWCLTPEFVSHRTHYSSDAWQPNEDFRMSFFNQDAYLI